MISPGTATTPDQPAPGPLVHQLLHAPWCARSTTTATTDPENNPLTYSWNFGDTTSGTGVTTSHTYTSAGTAHRDTDGQ